MATPTPLHGFVFYPRSYVLSDQDPDKSYVDGVDSQGAERRVYLNPDDRSRENARQGTAETIPMLDRFAQTDRRAKNPCFASADNGPESPDGVFLIEQAQFREDGVVEARWASVLSESSDTPPPAVGIGGLEVHYHPRPSEETAGLLSQYRALEGASGVDAIVERSQLHNKILESRRMWAIVSLIKPELAAPLGPSKNLTLDDLHHAANPFLDRYTKEGHYGGVWFRVRQGSVIDPAASVMANRQFDYKSRAVQTLDQVWEGFDRFQAGALKRALRMPGVEIDVIPMERINAGKAGNDKFKKGWAATDSGGTPKLQKLFVDQSHYLNPLMDPVKANAQLVAHIAVRRAKIYSGETKGNCLVSSVHAFSRPLGHPLEIGPGGDRMYHLKGRQPEKAAEEGGPAPG